MVLCFNYNFSFIFCQILRINKESGILHLFLPLITYQHQSIDLVLFFYFLKLLTILNDMFQCIYFESFQKHLLAIIHCTERTNHDTHPTFLCFRVFPNSCRLLVIASVISFIARLLLNSGNDASFIFFQLSLYSYIIIFIVQTIKVQCFIFNCFMFKTVFIIHAIIFMKQITKKPRK